MPGLTRYGEKAGLKYFFGSTVPLVPGTFYMALSSVNPGYAGTVTEPTYTGYARAAILNNNTNFGAYANTGASGTVLNGAVITFGTCTAGDGTVTHGALFDDLTVGTCWAFGSLTPHKIISAGDVPQFAIGALAHILAPT